MCKIQLDNSKQFKTFGIGDLNRSISDSSVLLRPCKARALGFPPLPWDEAIDSFSYWKTSGNHQFPSYM